MSWNTSNAVQKLLGLAIACLVVGIAMASFAVAPTSGQSNTQGTSTLAATISR